MSITDEKNKTHGIVYIVCKDLQTSVAVLKVTLDIPLCPGMPPSNFSSWIPFYSIIALGVKILTS